MEASTGKGRKRMSKQPVFIEVAAPDEIRLVAELAAEIWSEHYVTIITKEQIAYMLQRFQSEEAIAAQIEREGYHYFLIVAEDQSVGYIGIKPEADKLFLSKLYVHAAHRGKGYARAGIEMVAEWCRARGLGAIELVVNRNNQQAIAAYERTGFLPIRTQVVDIGEGHVMDDIVMQKPVALEVRERI